MPTISNNGIIGSWSPALDNTTTTTYTFTPSVGQCATTATLTITINDFASVLISSGCNGLDFELSASLITNATYEWYDFNGNFIGSDSSVIITTEGTYEVQVNLNGCVTSEFITINNIFCSIPKGVSPNGDGLNDSWDLSNFDIDKVEIFNRYGTEVYSKRDYTNEWNGRSNNGNELPTATYYYVIFFKNNTTKTGWVYLNREN